MIKTELFTNDGAYTPYYTPTLKTSKKLSELNLTSIPHQYANGCIHTDNIAHFNKLTKVTQNGSTFTLTKNCESGFVDVISMCYPWTVQSLTNAPNVIGKNASGYYNTMYYDGDGYPSVLYDYRFVNDVNANNVTIQINPVLVFFGYGQPTIGYNRFGLYGYLRGYDNIINFLNGETATIKMGRHNADSGNYTRFIHVNINDFDNGLHEYSGDGYKIWVWIAGLNLNAAFLGDTWQNKDWSYQYYTSNVFNAYCLKIKDTDNEYLINELSRDYPDYNADYFGDVMPFGFNLTTHYCDLAPGCIFTDIECDVDNSVSETTTNLHQHGDNWIFFNNDNKPRIYFCCNKREIYNQLAGVFRAWVDGATINYYSNDAKQINFNVNEHCIYNAISDNVYQGYVVRGTNNNIDLLSDYQKTNSITNSTYDYTKDRPAEEKDFGDLVSKIGINTQTATTGKQYKIQPGDVYTVLNFIGGTYSTDLIMSPSDGLISFAYYPFDIPSANVGEIPHIGAYNDNGTIKGFPMPPNVSYLRVYGTSFMIDLGSTNINAMYNDFRDYPPYTTYSAFIPFINTSYTIDFGVFKNHTIGFKLIVDVLTGSAICCIMRDRLLYDTVNGSVSTQISINSADMAQYNASIKATENAMQANELNAKLAMVNMMTGLTSSIAGVAMGNIGSATGAVSSVAGGLSTVAQAALAHDMLDYQLQTTQVHHSTIQSASANCGNQLERQVHIIIAHAKMLPEYDASTYADTVGYACCKNTTLSTCSHFTQIADINIDGITATDSEKNMIKTALINGVIIK